LSAETISAIANVAVALFAAIALWVGWRQVLLSREMSALEAYENYHVVAVEHPEFASGRFDFEAAAPDEVERYCLFVHFVLMAGERVLRLFPNDRAWTFAVEDDVRIHRRFISSVYFEEYLAYQDPRMSVIIQRVLKEEPNPERGMFRIRCIPVGTVARPQEPNGTGSSPAPEEFAPDRQQLGH